MSELSILEDELESERLDVLLVETLALRLLSELSRLEEELESDRLEV